MDTFLRGVVVILGKVGKNFGAGMSGGIAFVLDLDPKNVNLHMVDLQPVASGIDRAVSVEYGDVSVQVEDSSIKKWNKDAKMLQNLLEEHFERTRSAVAQNILANLPDYIPRQVFVLVILHYEFFIRFTKVFPKDMKRVLKQAIQDYVTTGSSDAAALLDDWDTMTSHKHDGFHLQSLPYTLTQFAEKFQIRRRQLKRLSVLDVAESALDVLGNLHEPSALFQYAAELERTGRLNDLLAEDSSEQLSQLMRMCRFVYAHVRIQTFFVSFSVYYAFSGDQVMVKGFRKKSHTWLLIFYLKNSLRPDELF